MGVFLMAQCILITDLRNSATMSSTKQAVKISGFHSPVNISIPKDMFLSILPTSNHSNCPLSEHISVFGNLYFTTSETYQPL